MKEKILTKKKINSNKNFKQKLEKQKIIKIDSILMRKKGFTEKN